MEKYCIINTTNKEVVKKLEEYGYICIPTEKSTDVSGPISLHADVLYLKTDDKTIYVSECQKNNIKLLKQMGYTVKTVKLSPSYKTESKLNMVITDDIILCNPKTCIDLSEIKGNRKIIPVNQGYTKCSTVVIDNDNFITEDESIYNALIQNGKNCLLIEKGYVRLEGYEYGFIGGASAYFENERILLFFGNIKKQKHYINIINFCSKNNIKIDYIKNIHIFDIGGSVII